MNDIEVWKPHPEFCFIEASTLGNVRTLNREVTTNRGTRLLKGRVLKPHRNKTGYLSVVFGMNGKQVHKRVHRLVAETFIPNPNGWPQVNHKDCDRTNNSVSNLEWCDASYNQRYREKYGVSNTESLGHPLFAVNLETLEVFKFRSQHEAGRQLGVHHQSSITQVLKGKQNQTGGYWFTENKSEITKNKLREIKDSMWYRGVFAVNLKTLEISWFKSQMAASRELGINQAHICKVVKGERRTAKGYWFTEDKNRATKITKSELHEVTTRKSLGRPVFAINFNTLEVFRFKSQSEAGRQLGFSAGSVSDVIKGRLKQVRGYWFVNIGNNAVESTRVKFGDSVARKVEELITDKYY